MNPFYLLAGASACAALLAVSPLIPVTVTPCTSVFTPSWHVATPPPPCVNGSCTTPCYREVSGTLNPGFMTSWCECGGKKNGIDDDLMCHSVDKYQMVGNFFVIVDYECIGVCFPVGDECHKPSTPVSAEPQCICGQEIQPPF